MGVAGCGGLVLSSVHFMDPASAGIIGTSASISSRSQKFEEDWSAANNLSRNVTGLGPGATYIFQVRCENKIGWSAWTPYRYGTMIAGARIRRDGKWTATAAFVQNNGKWHEAVPYVRDGGTWHRVE